MSVDHDSPSEQARRDPEVLKAMRAKADSVGLALRRALELAHELDDVIRQVPSDHPFLASTIHDSYGDTSRQSTLGRIRQDVFSLRHDLSREAEHWGNASDTLIKNMAAFSLRRR